MFMKRPRTTLLTWTIIATSKIDASVKRKVADSLFSKQKILKWKSSSFCITWNSYKSIWKIHSQTWFYKHLVAFHALRGCATISYFSAHLRNRLNLKRTETTMSFLKVLGIRDLIDQKFWECEEFVCNMYKQNTLPNDAVRITFIIKS